MLGLLLFCLRFVLTRFLGFRFFGLGFFILIGSCFKVYF